MPSSAAALAAGAAPTAAAASAGAPASASGSCSAASAASARAATSSARAATSCTSSAAGSSTLAAAAAAAAGGPAACPAAACCRVVSRSSWCSRLATADLSCSFKLVTATFRNTMPMDSSEPWMQSVATASTLQRSRSSRGTCRWPETDNSAAMQHQQMLTLREAMQLPVIRHAHQQCCHAHTPAHALDRLCLCSAEPIPAVHSYHAAHAVACHKACSSALLPHTDK